MTFIFPNAQLTSAPTPPGSLSNFSYLEKRKKTYGQSLVGIQVHSRTSADFCHICNLYKFCIFNNLLKNMLPSEPKFPKKSHCVAPRFRYHCILHRYLLNPLDFFYVRTYSHLFNKRAVANNV